MSLAHSAPARLLSALLVLAAALTACGGPAQLATPTSLPTNQTVATPAPALVVPTASVTLGGSPATPGPATAGTPTPATVPTVSGTATATPVPNAWIDRAIRSTVKIFVVTDGAQPGDFKLIGGCSGSVVDPSGLILTNWHCIGVIPGEDDPSGLGLQPGEMFQSQGLTVLGLTESPQAAPQPTYIAKVMAGSPDLDVAVVKIFAMLDQSKTLPNPLPLTVMPLGDSSSDKVHVGDPVRIFGYPGAGSETVTESQAQVAGYFLNHMHPARPDITVDSLKLQPPGGGPGNSGGPVTNDRGEEIGIDEFGMSLPNSGSSIEYNGALLINLAKPYVQQAISGIVDPPAPRIARPGGAQPAAGSPTASAATPRPAAPSPTPQPTAPAPTAVPPTAAPAVQPSFGAITFGAGIQNNQLMNVGTSFPDTTTEVDAEFTYQGMQNGMAWGMTFAYNGTIVADNRNSWQWNSGPSGTWLGWLWRNNGKGLSPGKYDIVAFINGQAVQQAGFTIASSAPATATPNPSQGVAIQGTIVDADTGRGIPGAVFVVLKPGVTVQQWFNQNTPSSDVASQGTAGADGTFRVSPLLAPGNSYSVVAGAQGYQVAYADNWLVLPANANSSYTLKPISLQKQQNNQ